MYVCVRAGTREIYYLYFTCDDAIYNCADEIISIVHFTGVKTENRTETAGEFFLLFYQV